MENPKENDNAGDIATEDMQLNPPEVLEEEQQPTKILMVGLDYAGKTTLLYALKNCPAPEAVCTIGHNIERLEYQNKSYLITDIGGFKAVRCVRNYHAQNKSHIFYVVDISDTERFAEVQRDLHDVTANKDLQNAKLIILANKMDLVENFKADDLSNYLKLNLIKQEWKIHPCSAVKDKDKLWDIFRLL